MTSGLAEMRPDEHQALETGEARAADPPSSSSAAAERALRLVVLVWTGAWTLLMALPVLGATSSTPPLTTAMLLALLIGWAVVVLARLPVNGWYVAAFAVTAMVQALLTSPEEVWAGSGLLVTWTSIATLSAGFVIAGARGRLVVAGIALTQFAVLASTSWRDATLASAGAGILAASAYALADGMAAHVASSAIRRQARDTDEAAAELAREARRLAAREARRRETNRVSRLLHDTVLNTLGAIRRGVDGSEVDAVRSRCAQDLRVLHELRAETAVISTADALLHTLVERAAGLSLTLDLRDRIDSPDPIPADVVDAVAGACSEAFLNVAKHSGTRAATLDLAWDGTRLDVGIHDDGRGWSGEVPAERGIARSILGRAADAGVGAQVTTSTDGGTTVSLEWRSERPAEPRPDHADAERFDPALARALALVAVRAAGWVAGLMAFLTLVYWSSSPSPASLVALAILGGVLLLTGHVGVRRGRVPIPTAMALLLVAATVLVTALPARGELACDQIAQGWWGLDGAVVVLLPLVLLTRGWWWSAAGAAAMVAGALSLYLGSSPIPQECVGIPVVNSGLELSIVLAVVIFREALLRLWRRAADARERSERLRTTEVVRDATHRARDARVDGVLASAVPLLDGVAVGRRDPTDDEVRHECAAAEGALRALLTIGPDHDWVGDTLAEAVLHAHATGRRLEVMPSSAAETLPAESAAVPLRALLHALVDAMPVGGMATAALIAGADGASLTVVSVGRLVPVAAETRRELERDGIELESVQMGDQCLVEVRWT